MRAAIAPAVALVLACAIPATADAGPRPFVRLFGSLAKPDLGDLAIAVRGWGENASFLSAATGSAESSVGSLTWMPGGGAAFGLDIGYGFSAGVRAEYAEARTSGAFRSSYVASGRNALGPTSFDESQADSLLYSLRAIPLEAFVGYELRVGRRLSLTASLGAGPSFERFLFTDSYEASADDAVTVEDGDAATTYVDRYSASGDRRETAHAVRLRVSAALGASWRLTRSLGLFVEAAGFREESVAWPGKAADSYTWSGQSGPAASPVSASGTVDTSAEGHLRFYEWVRDSWFHGGHGFGTHEISEKVDAPARIPMKSFALRMGVTFGF